MLLTLDVGNTQIFAGVFSGEKLLLRFRKTSNNIFTSDELGLFLRQILRENDISPADITDVAAASVVPDVSRTAGELTVSDNYPDLDGWLEGIGSNTVVKINCTTVCAGQTVLPRQVTGLYGWDGGFVASNTEKVRQIGYGGSDSFTFEGGSNVTVGSIEFNLADGKLVEEGTPDKIFNSPESPRLQDFLSKVL